MINLPPYPKAPENNWKGLTLDELRMRRALVQARMEIQKYKLNGLVDGLFSEARHRFSHASQAPSVSPNTLSSPYDS